MTEWADHTINGVVYPLGHLHPFYMDVTPKGEDKPTYRVLVTYNHHPFTRDKEPGDPPEFEYTHDNDARTFCTERHGLSLGLPDVIRRASTGNAFHGKKRNYLILEYQQHNGQKISYWVAFNMQKARERSHDVSMFVVSAYPKPI